MAKVQFNCRLNAVTVKKIKRLAKARGISQADVIENWAMTLDVLSSGKSPAAKVVKVKR
jgi:hypothetical protein